MEEGAIATTSAPAAAPAPAPAAPTAPAAQATTVMPAAQRELAQRGLVHRMSRQLAPVDGYSKKMFFAMKVHRTGGPSTGTIVLTSTGGPPATPGGA